MAERNQNLSTLPEPRSGAMKDTIAGAWIDEDYTRVGYEIPFSRHFYEYEPPRPPEEIEEDIRELEGEIKDLMGEVLA